MTPYHATCTIAREGSLTPDHATYNIAIHMLCRARRPLEAQNLIMKMRAAGFKADATTYRPLVAAYGHTGDVDSADFAAYGHTGDVDRAADLLSQMEREGVAADAKVILTCKYI
ncbi:hypothetical protein T484DRAFT_1780193 [Baffinella frigidus]|nr:hypothetical protein T484DRAFT_1780193 [Cryptophyta sp. CCMP2293]